MSVRIEHDTFGEIEVPADKYWGANRSSLWFCTTKACSSNS